MNRKQLSAAMSHLSRKGWKKRKKSMTKAQLSEMMRARGLKGGRPRKIDTASV